MQSVRGWEQARARGLGRAYAVALGRWLEGAAAAITSEFPELRERSASAPRVRMRCNAKWETMHVTAELQTKGAHDDSL
eukprot:6212350-Pleurochrysis_carterae.AAC.4